MLRSRFPASLSSCVLTCCAAFARAPQELPKPEHVVRPGAESETAVPIVPRGAAHDVQDAFVAVAKAVTPSVVTVRAYVRKTEAEAAKPGPAWLEAEAAEYPGFRLVAAGSGFVVGADGDILTCRHALLAPGGEPAELIDVELHDRSRAIAEVVGAEPTVNLAILHPMVFPNGHPRTLPRLRFGDSDAMRVGQWVMGFGDPAGAEKFTAIGTFTAHPSRDCYQESLTSFFLQAAMLAHPQAYGGPLVDLDGRVIGVLAPRDPKPGGAVESLRLGIELAMPSKIVEGLYATLREVRSFKSPWLGVAVMSRAEIAAQRGVAAFEAMAKPRSGILIENVWSTGPAAAAGILPGDFLCAFGDVRVFTPVDFQRALYLAGIGGTAKLELFRNGKTFTRELVVEQRPPEAVPR